jgi:hypothetical protein
VQLEEERPADSVGLVPCPGCERCNNGYIVHLYAGRPTSAHEHVFLLSKSARYFYDADAVREEAEYGRRDTAGAWRGGAYVNQRPGQDNSVGTGLANSVTGKHPEAGRNLRNVWTIATEAFPDAHFATYPTALVERCIRAGTSERGCCAACGAPWVRVTENGGYTASSSHNYAPCPNKGHLRTMGERAANMTGGGFIPGRQRITTTTGWAASCACDAATVPCTVLDPFVGSGTTILVADRLQRDAIGIDLNTAYASMAVARIERDCPLFTSWAPAADPEDERMRDLFQDMAAD